MIREQYSRVKREIERLLSLNVLARFFLLRGFVVVKGVVFCGKDLHHHLYVFIVSLLLSLILLKGRKEINREAYLSLCLLFRVLTVTLNFSDDTSMNLLRKTTTQQKTKKFACKASSDEDKNNSTDANRMKTQP